MREESGVVRDDIRESCHTERERERLAMGYDWNRSEESGWKGMGRSDTEIPVLSSSRKDVFGLKQRLGLETKKPEYSDDS